MARGVQFRGVPELMKAFDNCKICNWAVKYDKNINAKSQGNSETESRAMLQEFLNALARSGSESMYSLNLYEDLPKNQKIKPSTEPDYSFNFTLFEEESYPNPYHGAGGSYGRLQKKVEELEAKLALAAARDEEDQDEEGGIMGTINGYLEDPRTKDFIMNKIFGFVDGMLKTPAPGAPVFNLPEQRQPAQVGKVTEEHLLTEDQTTKLQTAVGILATIDPNLGDNLLKIASVAQKDRMKYNQLIGLLNNFL